MKRNGIIDEMYLRGPCSIRFVHKDHDWISRFEGRDVLSWCPGRNKHGGRYWDVVKKK